MSPARHLPASADDVLAPLPPERRLTLVFERISAFVSVHTVPPSLSSRLAARARDALVRRRAAAAATSAAAQAAAAAGDVEAPKQQRPALPTPLQSGDAPPEHRQILHAVSGVVLPGEVLVLMGPSGSGKTSLLSVVSGRAPRAVRTQGRVTVNGGLFTKAAKRRVGFVLQDDMLFETLTVHETLAFAAELRLPRSTTPAQRAARVEGVVAALGLAKCRDTIVGGWERRGISGGERKRVSIGHELLIDPALLLLDEPTSGLDATTALHLARTLRRLASGGRAVCSTLHQPSSRIFLQLDRLMLLADGHVLYYGAAAAAVPWFATLGFACPYGVNVADFILDLAQGEVALDKSAVGKGGARLSLGGLEGLDEGAAASYGNGGGASDGGDGGDGDEDDDDEDKGALSPPGSRRTSGVFDAAKPAGLLRRSASGEGPLRGPAAVAALWRTYESHAAAAAKAMRAAAAAAAGGGAGVGGVGGDALSPPAANGPAGHAPDHAAEKAGGGLDPARPASLLARPPVAYRGFGGERSVLASLRLADGSPGDDTGRHAAAGEAAAAAAAAEVATAAVAAKARAEAAAAAGAEEADGGGGGAPPAAAAEKGGVPFVAEAEPAATTAAAAASLPAAGRSRSFVASMMRRRPSSSAGADDDANAPEFRREISRAFGGGGGSGGRAGAHVPAHLLNGNGAPFPASSSSAAKGAPAPRPSLSDRASLAMGLQDRGNATYWQQMRVLAARAARVRRFESLGTQRFVTIGGVAAVTGLCWWQRGRSDLVSGAGDVLGLLFFIILFPAFSSLFAALFAFPSEYGMLCKERQSGMYRVSAYFFSRALVDLPLETVYPSLFVIACYWMGWLRPEAWAFFAHWAAMLLVVLVAQSTGLLLGAVFMDAKKAQTSATILMLCWMLCGGY